MNRHEGTDEVEADSASFVSVEQLRRLVRLLDRSDVSELEVKRTEDGTRLVLRKAKASDDFSAMAGTQMVAPSALVAEIRIRCSSSGGEKYDCCATGWYFSSVGKAAWKSLSRGR